VVPDEARNNILSLSSMCRLGKFYQQHQSAEMSWFARATGKLERVAPEQDWPRPCRLVPKGNWRPVAPADTSAVLRRRGNLQLADARLRRNVFVAEKIPLDMVNQTAPGECGTFVRCLPLCSDLF
jgi:hypothetical protein